MFFRLPCLLALLLSAVPASGAELRLLSPGLSYCDELSARLARLPKARQDQVRGLALEGGRLCGSGHVRTGVAKLRRALREAQGAPVLAEPAHP